MLADGIAGLPSLALPVRNLNSAHSLGNTHEQPVNIGKGLIIPQHLIDDKASGAKN